MFTTPALPNLWIFLSEILTRQMSIRYASTALALNHETYHILDDNPSFLVDCKWWVFWSCTVRRLHVYYPSASKPVDISVWNFNTSNIDSLCINCTRLITRLIILGTRKLQLESFSFIQTPCISKRLVHSDLTFIHSVFSDWHSGNVCFMRTSQTD